MLHVAQAIVLIGALFGVILTVLTLPGTWVAVLAALGCQIWQPGLFSWWTLGVAIGLAVLGEVLEIGASAMGAGRAGASKRGALGGVVGSILGAIVGSMVLLFPIGTIVGAVVGAGLGAAIVERGSAGKTWAQSAKVGTGAAAGRFAATVLKTGIAMAIAAILGVGAFVR